LSSILFRLDPLSKQGEAFGITTRFSAFWGKLNKRVGIGKIHARPRSSACSTQSDAWRGTWHNHALFQVPTKHFLGEIEQTRRHPQNPRQTTLIRSLQHKMSLVLLNGPVLTPWKTEVTHLK
jgi:hypothetical protein